MAEGVVMKIFIAAPWDLVRTANDMRSDAAAMWWVCTSRWINLALMLGPSENVGGGESFLQEKAKENDEDIARADVFVLLSHPQLGGECYLEARYALTLGKPVIWIGARRNMLSRWRPGVTRVADWEGAKASLRNLAGEIKQ
jgi:hypothetical protein